MPTTSLQTATVKNRKQHCKEKITLNTNKKEESQDQRSTGFPFLIKCGTVGETTVSKVEHGC